MIEELDIDELRLGLALNQIRCPKCEEVVTSYSHLKFCPCGYIGLDCGGMDEEGRYARVILRESDNTKK